jgi:hypothetical protein
MGRGQSSGHGQVLVEAAPHRCAASAGLSQNEGDQGNTVCLSMGINIFDG